MSTIFTVRNEDLARLDQKSAVQFFRELIWAEAMRFNTQISAINVSENTNIQDEGIDASVDLNNAIPSSNIIRSGLTTYQIKSGENFSPWQEREISKELFKGDIIKDNINRGIKNTMDKDGTYILVCTSIDLTYPRHRDATKHIKSKLKDICNYPNPKVEVWSQNNLIGFLKFFPSLSLKLNERDRAKFQTHNSWAKDDDMNKELKAGNEQLSFIKSVQEGLRKNESNTTHIRIIGEPGIGKTKLVFEASNTEDLKPLVIYTTALSFRDSSLMYDVLKEDNIYNAILILDECDEDSRAYIWNKLKNRGSRIKLITIYNEGKQTTGEIVLLTTPSLTNSNISEIIQTYGILKDVADRFSYLCSGSPRVAHVLGNNLRYNPDDLLKEPDNVNIWERYITGGDRKNSDEVKRRAFVLEHLSLFKKIGYEDESEDLKTFSEFIVKKDPSITSSILKGIIGELRQRKILQGEYVLYITPKLLHLWLWNKWWETYGKDFNMEVFSEDFTSNMKNSFYAMFEYAATSDTSLRIVKKLLGEKGPFYNDEFLKTQLGASFFLALAKAAPEDALRCIKRLLGSKTKNELLNFTVGRREVIWALEYTGQFRHMFKDTIILLLKLAEAENENWSNNATGVFSSFFTLGRGLLAPTETPPIERLEILKEIIQSKNTEKRKLALKGINASLQENRIRSIGIEGEAISRQPNRWIPKTYKEIYDALSKSWNLLINNFDRFSQEEKKEVLKILMDNLYNIAKYGKLGDILINSIKNLNSKSGIDKKVLVEGVIRTTNWLKKDAPEEYIKRWDSLIEILSGSDFKSQLKRYVGMQLIEDEYDEKGNKVKILDIKLLELADEALRNKTLLEDEYNWLMTNEAIRGHMFGYVLGKSDLEFSMLDKLIDEQKKANENMSFYFLGGYLRALSEKDIHKYEEIITSFSHNVNLIKWIPEIVCRAKLTDDLAILLDNLLIKKYIEVEEFLRFKYGAVFENISEEVFIKLINTFLNQKKYISDSLCLNLCLFYFIRFNSTKKLPKEIILEIVLRLINIDKQYIRKRDQMDNHNWQQLCEVFLKQYPKEKINIAHKLIETFGLESSITNNIISKAREILLEITSEYPKEIWDYLKKYIGPPSNKRAFELTMWLKGSDESYLKEAPALELIPINEIFAWIDEDINKRAWYVAYFVPNKLFRGKDKVCYAREILVRYGDRDDVKRNMWANFSTGGWSGPGSLHFQNKKEKLLEFKKHEENVNVINWIDYYVSILDEDIKREKIEEERFDR